jgi:AraC-like DNA-binding protein
MSASSKLDVDQKQHLSSSIPRRGPIPLVRANAITPFCHFLNGLGAPLERLLHQARLPTAILADPEALVPVLSAYRFVELAAQRAQSQDLGARVGQQASAFDLGIYGAALRETSTVYEYLQIGVQLISGHSSGTRLWLRPEGDMIRLNQYLTEPAGPGRCIADLYTLALTIGTLRRLLGAGWSPAEVRLMTGTEIGLGDLDVLGEAALVLGQKWTSFTMHRSALQTLVRIRDGEARRQSTSRLDGIPPMPADFRLSAEQLIDSLLRDGYATVDNVAEAAGMSVRTLQRRLAESGITYAGLVAESRIRIAKQWLEQSDMPVADIAVGLGYTAASNFTRAFRRRTGLSPAAYRRRQLDA